MTSKLRTLLGLFICTLAITFFAFIPKNLRDEGSLLQKLIAKVTFFENNYPQEKVYLQLDKPYYAAGEDIWFSAYLVNSSDHAPSPLSKVLYVELINPQDSVFTRVALSLEKGRGAGDFALSDTIPAGLYRVRAYTSWMQNFDEDYFFHQNLQIWNARESDLIPTAAYSFQRQAAGDSVLVQLQLTDHKTVPAAQVEMAYSVAAGAKRPSTRKAKTDAQGRATLRFFLPDGSASEKAQLNLSFPQPKGMPMVSKTLLIPQPTHKLDLQFFPEGGNLVSGFWNTIGFKAVNAQGLGQDVKGTIHDQTGAKVADFASLKFGIGRLGFMPEKGKRYVAKIPSANGKKETYALPQPLDQGIVMTVDNSKPEKVRVKSYAVGFAGSTNKPTSLHLVVQSRGSVVFGASSAASGDIFQVDIPKEKFPSGISQITLFNQAGEPLSERLVFVNHRRNLQISIAPDKPVYKPREKVTLLVEVKDAAGNPVSGDFSMSVTDQTSVIAEPYSGNLISYLQLSSDLKGYIEQPSYYFTSESAEVVKALDNLMLTQGWRRFIWKDILQDAFPAMAAPLEQGLSIDGLVTKYNKKPEPNALVTLIDVKNLRNTQYGESDAQGKFSIPLAPLTDSSKIVVQARNKKDKSFLLVTFDAVAVASVKPRVPYAPLAPPLSPTQIAYLRANREQAKVDQSMGKGILLGEVLVRGKKNTDSNRSLADRSTLHSQAEVSYSVAGPKLIPGQNILISLARTVPSLTYTGGEYILRGASSLNMGAEAGAGLSNEPLFLVDGTATDASGVETISEIDVERIDVLMPGAPSAIYGSSGVNGVISVILKRGKMYSVPSKAHLRGIAIYKGPTFQTVRQFYQPMYDKPSQVHTPDWRTTLYWNPTIKTNAAGQATLSFYAADGAATYRAVVEGLSSQGQLGSGTGEAKVR